MNLNIWANDPQWKGVGWIELPKFCALKLDFSFALHDCSLTIGLQNETNSEEVILIKNKNDSSSVYLSQNKTGLIQTYVIRLYSPDSTSTYMTANLIDSNQGRFQLGISDKYYDCGKIIVTLLNDLEFSETRKIKAYKEEILNITEIEKNT